MVPVKLPGKVTASFGSMCNKIREKPEVNPEHAGAEHFNKG